ncbi:MAG: lysylphosphatidylglycerol synthase transmembrane domain-containing protein [Thermonemataceae bacterium]
MKLLSKIFLSYVLPLAIGLALFWYVVFSRVSLEDLLSHIREAKFSWILVSFGLGVLSHWARAYRWKFLLAPLGYRLPIGKGFVAVMVGYFANLILPRMGEVTRCGILQKMEGIPAHTSFGTVITERIIDLLILITLTITIFFIEFDNLSDLIINTFTAKLYGVNNHLTLLAALSVVGVLFLIVVFLIWRRYREKLRTYAFYNKVSHFTKGIWEGVKSVRRIKNKPAFIFYTVLIWVLYYWMAYVLFFCFPATADLGLLAGFAILIMGGIGMAAPVQGGIGAYHFLVSQTLAVYGLQEELGITFATFMHAMQTSVVVIAGGLCFIISLLIRRSAASSLEKKLEKT